VGTRGNDVPRAFCTSNVTWRFRFSISVSACSAWSSKNEQMTTYLVYSTAAPKWNRKLRCGNYCRRINLPLCLVWERHSHTYFWAIYSCLPATIFGQKFSSARNQMLFINQYSAVSNNLFSTCCTVFLKLRYRDIVAFRTKNWMDEILVIDSLQTSRFALWRGKDIVWLFSMPLRCNKHLPGQSASIIIAFEIFGMFASLRNPSIFLRGGKVVLVFEIIYLFLPSRYFYGQMTSASNSI